VSVDRAPLDRTRRWRWWAAAFVVLAIAAVPAAADGRTQALSLVHIAKLNAPLYATAPAGATGKLYVVERLGEIITLTNGQPAATPFLDISSLVTTSNEEQGLLSMAFDPDYAKNHRFYVDYTDVNGDTRVMRYVSNGTTAIPSSAHQLLYVKDFAPNHNGGQLQFGPDGRLYWSNGDGGGEGDPNDNGQNLSRPFAKIMRLNVNAASPRWQLVAYGLRNPWRFSFDRANGDLYIGDVGQNKWEEIDYLKRGYSSIANFGWKHYEGNHVYDASTPLLTTGHYVPPIVEYSHQDGNCAVIGGFVYRGASVKSAVGRYFYGDNCTGIVWSLKVVNGHATDVRVEPFKVPGLSAFGQDSQGELYLMSYWTGDIFRLAG
jgi:glucose/arabinose dehydrogenase